MAEQDRQPERWQKEQKSIPELMGDLAHELSTLVSEEIALAKAEISAKIAAGQRAAGLLSASMVAGLMALGSATALAIIALSLAFPAWLAALIVTAAWGLIAGIFALAGSHEAKEVAPPIPEETVETLKEDARWLRNPTRSGTR